MKIKNKENEILITLINNSCDQLINWAQKEEYGMFEWFFNIIKKDSENIYNRTILNESKDEYKINCKKIENIYVFVSDLIHNLKEIFSPHRVSQKSLSMKSFGTIPNVLLMLN